MDYENKYLKYKSKYLCLQQKGGNIHIKKVNNDTFDDAVGFNINSYNKIYLIIGYGTYDSLHNLELKNKIEELIMYIKKSNPTDSNILFMCFGDPITIDDRYMFETNKKVSIADIICYILFKLKEYTNINFAFVNRRKSNDDDKWHASAVTNFVNLNIDSKKKYYIHYDFGGNTIHMNPSIYGGIKLVNNDIYPLSNTYIWNLLYNMTDEKNVWEMITIGGGNIAIGEYILAKSLKMKITNVDVNAKFQNAPKINHLNTYIANHLYLNTDNTYEKIEDEISDVKIIQDIVTNPSDGKNIY